MPHCPFHWHSVIPQFTWHSTPLASLCDVSSWCSSLPPLLPPSKLRRVLQLLQHCAFIPSLQVLPPCDSFLSNGFKCYLSPVTPNFIFSCLRVSLELQLDSYVQLLAISEWLSNRHSRFNTFKKAVFILSWIKLLLLSLSHLCLWHPPPCLGPRSRSLRLHILFSLQSISFTKVICT